MLATIHVDGAGKTGTPVAVHPAMPRLPLLLLLLVSLLCISCQGPHLRSRSVQVRTYEATMRCSQGPLEAHFVAEGARWGEGIEIRACGPRGVQAQTRIEVDGEYASSGPIGWADDPWDNSRCVLHEVERGVADDGDSVQKSNDEGAAASANDARASAAPSTQVQAFRDTGFPGTVCPNGDVTVFRLGPLRKGAAIHVKLWSDQPNDFEAALVQIRQRVYWPSVSDAEWEKHVARREEKQRRREEKRRRREEEMPPPTEEELRARLAEAEIYSGPTGAPPPARLEVAPPKVSVNAEWIPGYWHWAHRAWLWIPGDWRVPAADLAQGRTLRAGHMPPALQAESIPSAPSDECVWAPGYWSWHSGRYLWIAGSWRLRPSHDAIWVRSSWRVSGRGAVFLPGGWRR